MGGRAERRPGPVCGGKWHTPEGRGSKIVFNKLVSAFLFRKCQFFHRIAIATSFPACLHAPVRTLSVLALSRPGHGEGRQWLRPQQLHVAWRRHLRAAQQACLPQPDGAEESLRQGSGLRQGRWAASGLGECHTHTRTHIDRCTAVAGCRAVSCPQRPSSLGKGAGHRVAELDYRVAECNVSSCTCIRRLPHSVSSTHTRYTATTL